MLSKTDDRVVYCRVNTAFVDILEELRPFEEFNHMYGTRDQTYAYILVLKYFNYICDGVDTRPVHKWNARHVYYQRFWSYLWLFFIVRITERVKTKAYLKDIHIKLI